MYNFKNDIFEVRMKTSFLFLVPMADFNAFWNTITTVLLMIHTHTFFIISDNAAFLPTLICVTDSLKTTLISLINVGYGISVGVQILWKINKRRVWNKRRGKNLSRKLIAKYYQIQYSNLSHHTKYGHIPLVKWNDLRFWFHRANVFMVLEKRILSQSLLFWANEFLKI